MRVGESAIPLFAVLLLPALWPIRLLKRESHTLDGIKPFELYQFFIVNSRFLGFNRNILMSYKILSKFIPSDRKSENILVLNI
jgi:hypothetical protein